MAAVQHVGIIKSFNPTKGWGFVDCPEAGADAFVLKHDLNGYAVKKGDQISFTVSTGPKGPQANNIKVLTVAPDGSRSFFGEVKSFNPAKGFGFLSSPACQEQFDGKDVFVLRENFEGGIVVQGAQVVFKAKMAERGPIASEVRLLGVETSLQQGGWGAPMMGGKGGAFGAAQGKGGWGAPAQAWGAGYAAQGASWNAPGGKGGDSWGQGGGDWRKDPQENETFFGTLKNMNEEKGFGFIACDAVNKMYGKDLFVMKDALDSAPPVHPGQLVSFNVAQGQKGPHAINIQPFSEQSAGMVFTGEVKSFNDTKGWGFISSAQADPIFHSDIFLHKRDLNGKTVRPGDQIQFTVDISGGRASARTICLAAVVTRASF